MNVHFPLYRSLIDYSCSKCHIVSLLICDLMKSPQIPS